MLHELVPTATDFAYLVNPSNPLFAQNGAPNFRATAEALGLTLHTLNASSDRELELALASAAQLRVAGLVIGTGDAFFNSRGGRLGELTVRHKVPAIYHGRDFIAAGGLASYGGSVTDSYRLAGIYTGRILKGEKPADLPVQQSTKVEMFLNLKTAKAFGITVPLPLLARADEVIE